MSKLSSERNQNVLFVLLKNTESIHFGKKNGIKSRNCVYKLRHGLNQQHSVLRSTCFDLMMKRTASQTIVFC